MHYCKGFGRLISVGKIRALSNKPTGVADSVFAVDPVVASAIKNAGGRSMRRVSVSNIISATQSPNSARALDTWRKKVVAEKFSGNEEKFKQHEVSSKKAGIRFYDNVTKRLLGYSSDTEDSKEPMNEKLNAFMKSLEPVLKQVTAVHCVKLSVVHPQLRYAGECHALLTYRGTPCIVTWKSNSSTPIRRRTTWQFSGQPIDAALQLSAYAAALNLSESVAPAARPMALQNVGSKLVAEPFVLQQPINNGLIVTAYADGSSADVIELNQADLAHCWKCWVERVVAFWTNGTPESTESSSEKLVTPISSKVEGNFQSFTKSPKISGAKLGLARMIKWSEQATKK